MTNLEYPGDLTKDIKLLQKTNPRRQNLLFKLDLIYMIILLIYLIFVFVRVANGMGMIPSLTTFINSLIIIRSSISIKNTSNKSRAISAKFRITKLIKNIFNIKNEGNNLSGKLDIDNFEQAFIIEEKGHVKKYDENDKVYSKVDTISNYIYLIDSENSINVLKEIKETITSDANNKTVETRLELLDTEDIPENLPVKQVLKLKK